MLLKSNFVLNWEKDESKQKEAGFKKSLFTISDSKFCDSLLGEGIKMIARTFYLPTYLGRCR